MTQFALGHARIESLPLKARNVIGAGDGAIAAADALIRIPPHDAGFLVLVQSLKWTACRASRIQTVHALAFHKRERRAIFGLIELDDVAGYIIQIRRRLMEVVAASIGRSVICLCTRSYASFATDADAGIVEQPHSRIRNGDVFRLQRWSSDRDSYGRRHSGLGDGG